MQKTLKALFIVLALIFTGCNVYTSPVAENTALINTTIIVSPDVTPAITIINTPSPTPTVTVELTPTMEPFTDIIIGATGDIMCHIQQVDDANAAGGKEGYSFYHWFEYIKPALQYPDLMIANLEGPIAGAKYGYDGYPMFNFPDEIVPAIKDAGIDVLLNGNNHIMDKNITGINRTIDILDNAGMYHTGAWASPEARKIPLVIDVNGIKIGIISPTYSLNGFAQHIDPQVLEYLVCYIDEEQVKKQIDLCKEYGAEIIIVSPHMGDEFEKHTRRGLRETAAAYIKMGADIIFGHHPHVVGNAANIEVELEDGTIKKGLAFWSLGNFISSMYGISKEAGCIAYVGLRRDNTTQEISITSVEYLPTWTYRHGLKGNEFHILPVGETIDNPELIDELNPNRGAFYKLNSVWDSTIETLGGDIATPLRNVPEKE